VKVELIPIDSVIVEDRGREDFGAVGELAESIRTKGLLHPLVVDENNKLIAGERRLRALKLLKWETVPVNRFNDLDELTKVEIELEENTKRKSLTWQEESKLIQRAVEMRRGSNPEYKIENDPLLDKMGETTLKENLFLARMQEKFPSIAKEKDKSNAVRLAKRMQEKEVRSLLVKAAGSTPLTTLASPTSSVKSYSVEGVTLYLQDCLEGVRNLPSESIDLIITDYPFGIDFGNNADFLKRWDEVYDDSKDSLLSILLPETLKEFKRILKPGAHFYIFYPTVYHEQFRLEISKHLTLQHVPLIWDKKTGGTSFAPYRVYAPNYEGVFYGWKGESQGARKLSSPGYCVLDFPNLTGGNKVHPAEKPVELISYLINQSTIEGETVLDCFSGSGVTLEACLRMNRKGIAFELSQRWYELGVSRLMFHVKERK
jgi:site-specific DNA-methyltransferase (adenine-specific)